MRVINFEDSAIKHYHICEAIKRCGDLQSDWATTLEQGVDMLQDAADSSDYYNTW